MDLPTVSRNECGVFISDSVFAPERAATDFHTRKKRSAYLTQGNDNIFLGKSTV